MARHRCDFVAMARASLPAMNGRADELYFRALPINGIIRARLIGILFRRHRHGVAPRIVMNKLGNVNRRNARQPQSRASTPDAARY